MTVSYSPTSWAQALLTAIGAPASNANVAAVTAWEAAEGGHWHNTARYNPLNTTQPEPGSTTVNSVGVRAYGSWDQGLDATVTTLENGRYSGILTALGTGTDPEQVAAAIVASPWGTKTIPLGPGVSAGPAEPAAATGTPALSITGDLTGLVFTAAVVLGGVALLVLGVGRATGTEPLKAAAAATPARTLLRGARRVRR